MKRNETTRNEMKIRRNELNYRTRQRWNHWEPDRSNSEQQINRNKYEEKQKTERNETTRIKMNHK